MPGLLIFIDFEKALNSLKWNFLFNCLNVFNFSPNFTLSVGWKPFAQIFKVVFRLFRTHASCQAGSFPVSFSFDHGNLSDCH